MFPLVQKVTIELHSVKCSLRRNIDKNMDEIWKRSLRFAADNSPVRRRSLVRPPAFGVDGFYQIHNIADDDEK